MPPAPEPPDLREHGRAKDGSVITSERRLFMQLLAFGGCPDPAVLLAALTAAGLDAVLYADVNDPRGVAVLALSEDPAVLVERWRPLLNRPPFAALPLKPEYTMLGRTYAVGYEADLDETLIHRPRRTVLTPAWGWAVWYPLRRAGAFARLDEAEQKRILGEHAMIGRAFGAADYAHDIRLDCRGLDAHDNDFVVGLVGKTLHPLSAVVQAMRQTRQTSEFIAQMGPFFVGRVVWQSLLKPART